MTTITKTDWHTVSSATVHCKCTDCNAEWDIMSTTQGDYAEIPVHSLECPECEERQ